MIWILRALYNDNFERLAKYAPAICRDDENVKYEEIQELSREIPMLLKMKFSHGTYLNSTHVKTDVKIENIIADSMAEFMYREQVHRSEKPMRHDIVILEIEKYTST